MSWTATAWAKERIKGLSAPYDKLMLMVLADYAHPESHEAWPTQATLAEVLGTSERQVRRSIRSLEREGLVKQIAKGNQYQKSLYRLEVILSGAQVQVPDNSAPDILSPAHAPDRIDQVHRTKLTSAPDSPATSSLQEPPLEPPEENTLVESKWIQVLERDPRWTAREGYAEDVEELYAQTIDLHSEAVRAYEWLQTPRGRKRLKLGLFFLNWLKRAMPSDNGSKPTMTRAERLRADHKAYEMGE